MNQISSRAWDALNTFGPVGLFDSGLADALVLETYEHGTSPASYDSIMLHGVDPRFGGTGGETSLRINEEQQMAFAEIRTLNRFFVFDHHPRCGSILPSFMGSVIQNIWVRQYAMIASMAEERRKGVGILRNVTGCLLGLAAPTIKVRFRSDDPSKNFENDEFFEPGFASYTEHKISVDHIGIRGTLQQGLNEGLWNRVKSHLTQVIWGVAKMVTAVALVVLAVIASIHSPLILAISLTYLAIKTTQAIAQFVVPLLNRSPVIPQFQNDSVERALINHFTQHVDVRHEQPVAILFSGCSGAGKTTVRKRLISGKESEYVQLDSDQIMEKMPEYHRLLNRGVKDAAAILHKDSLRVRTKIMNCAIDQKQSLIIDGTGSNLLLYKDIIKKLRKQNYQIKLIRCETTLEEAKKRVHKREQETGRHVPEEAIEFSYDRSALHLHQLTALVDDYHVIKT